MTKPELVARIAEKTNLSKKNATAALTALIDTITKVLKAEGKLAIPNLGTFEVKQHAARTLPIIALGYLLGTSWGLLGGAVTGLLNLMFGGRTCWLQGHHRAAGHEILLRYHPQ